ncbi:MAG: TonB-dependent receptor [Planctomycetota bacterium]
MLEATACRALVVSALPLFLAAGAAAAGAASPSAPIEEDPAPDEEPPELPAVLVTGRRAAEGVPAVPLPSVGSRNVLGPEQVRETGARDVNDLVLHLPAISTRPYNGGEAAAPSFSTRGLPDDGLTEYIQVLIDGVPASPLPYGWTAFSFFPLTPDRIHALDYLRGAHSVRYSPNTVGGVLNFLTPPLPDRTTIGSRSTFGAFDYASTLLWGGMSDGRTSWSTTYVDRRGEGYRRHGEFDQQDFNLRVRRELGESEEDFLAVSFTYMEDEHQAPGGLTRSQYRDDRFDNARPKNRFAGYRGVADVVYHAELAREAWIEGFSYLSLTNRHLTAQRPHFPTDTDVLTLSDWVDDSYAAAVGVRTERKYEAGGREHTVFAGARIHRDWIPSWSIDSVPYDGGSRTPLQDNEYSMTSYSAHVDDTFQPVEDLTVTAGIRLEYIPDAHGENDTGTVTFDYDDEYFALLPGIGVSYLVTPRWAVFANYFEGFRAPQVWGFGSTPDPDTSELEFEESQAWEVGTRYEAAAGLGGAATLWDNHYDSFGVFYSGYYENLGEIGARGVDLEATWDAGKLVESLAGLRTFASVTLQNAEIEGGPNEGHEVPYAWETKAALRARYEWGRGWLASVGGTYVGNSYSDEANTAMENENGNLGRNPTRTLIDAQLAKELDLGFGKLRLGVGATNLLEEDWFVHSRGGFFGGGKVAGPPRQSYALFDLTITP